MSDLLTTTDSADLLPHEPSDQTALPCAESSLSAKQLAVATSLLNGATVAEAARQHDIHRSTVCLWQRRDPAFAQIIQEFRQEFQDSVLANLCNLGRTAVANIGDLMTDPDVPAAVRVRISEFILKRML